MNSIQSLQAYLKKLSRTINYVRASSAPSYKVYTALITQSGTDAPVATVLENTLGGTVVWSRQGLGDYRATLTNAFPDGKTLVLPSNSGVTLMPIGYNLPFDYGYLTQRIDNNTIGLTFVQSSDYGAVEMSDLMGSNQTFIEIRVYP